MQANKRVYATDYLDEVALQDAIQKRADTIVFYDLKSSLQIPESIEAISAEIVRIEGTWECDAYNQKTVESLWLKTGKKLVLEGYDIKPSIKKFLYWTNLKTGALNVLIKQSFEDSELLFCTPYFKGNKIKNTIKYFKHFLSNNFMALASFSNSKFNSITGETGILANNDFELKMYKKVIETLKNKQLILFHYGNLVSDDYLELKNDIQVCDLSQIQSNTMQRFVSPFNLNNDEIQVLNTVSLEWNNISTELKRYEHIATTKIKKLLVNVAENLPLRNLMSTVFQGKIEVYNTMNGMKSGEAHDADVTFDKWFVWDEEMKKLLYESCHLKNEMLLVSGHLSQDYISQYSFSNSLNLDKTQIENKIIISIFSVRGQREEKREAFQALYQLISANQEYLVIVKPHPLELKSDFILPFKNSKNVIFVEDELKNSKGVVYDILHLSDICIVFGSTVSMESYWMGTPCLTFEKREKSLIYNVGINGIDHVRSKEEFAKALKNVSKLGKKMKCSNSGVAEFIAKHLCN